MKIHHFSSIQWLGGSQGASAIHIPYFSWGASQGATNGVFQSPNSHG